MNQQNTSTNQNMNENQNVRKKAVVFQTRAGFAIYTVLLIVVSLLAGGVIGTIVGSIARTAMYEAEKKQEEKEIKEASGEDYDITKCVKLGKYSGREVSLEVSEEDIQLEVDNLLEEYTTYEQEKGIAKAGDLVYAEFKGSVNGKTVDSACGSDYIQIGAGDWLVDLEQAFIGLKTGKSKKVSIDVPAGTFGDEEVDGHTVVFKITLKYICGDSIVPEYNDEFVQSVTEYKTVSEYNAYLKDKLAKEYEEEKEEYSWTEVLDDSKIKEYPDSLMEAAREEVLQGYYDMADLYGVTHDEIFQSFGCENEQEFKDTQLDDLAKDTVKEILVSKAIAYQEKIEYSKEDYENIVKDEYENYSDVYDSQEAYEKEYKDYLERTALIEAVKKWIGKKTNYKTTTVE